MLLCWANFSYVISVDRQIFYEQKPLLSIKRCKDRKTNKLLPEKVFQSED